MGIENRSCRNWVDTLERAFENHPKTGRSEPAYRKWPPVFQTGGEEIFSRINISGSFPFLESDELNLPMLIPVGNRSLSLPAGACPIFSGLPLLSPFRLPSFC